MQIIRAYSVLNIKEADDEKREIRGIATTPAVDSYGDIVESDGAQYVLPIPLLYQHNAREPIGRVTKASISDDGIDIEASLVKVDEPGALKDRLDEAWQSIKYGLVMGLSIGFRSIEHAFIEGGHGIRFIKWKWVELSAVTIPANEEATIQTVKSLDSAALARVRKKGVVYVDQRELLKPPVEKKEGAYYLNR